MLTGKSSHSVGHASHASLSISVVCILQLAEKTLAYLARSRTGMSWRPLATCRRRGCTAWGSGRMLLLCWLGRQITISAFLVWATSGIWQKMLLSIDSLAVKWKTDVSWYITVQKPIHWCTIGSLSAMSVMDDPCGSREENYSDFGWFGLWTTEVVRGEINSQSCPTVVHLTGAQWCAKQKRMNVLKATGVSSFPFRRLLENYRCLVCFQQDSVVGFTWENKETKIILN